MKKTIIFFILLLMTTIMAKANDGKIMLQSGGKVFFFDSDKINDAINAAEEGDTIDLAADYNNYENILINKNILFRGRKSASDHTYINSLTITSACRIEGIYLHGNIEVDKEISGLKITSCVLNGNIEIDKEISGLKITSCYISGIMFSADMPGMIIERCKCSSFCIDNLESKDININNCEIIYLYGGSSETRACTFRNCNIHLIYYPYGDNGDWTYVDKFINCILADNPSRDGECYANAMINCLFKMYHYNMDNIINCYNNDNIEDGNSFLYNGDCSYNKEQLLEKGLVGTDGTVVGVEGGAYPFTLTSINTSITKADISMDETNRKIAVDVEVKVE